MHDQTATGNDFFKCDFCRRGWSDDRPMVEGHRGSLICGPCLSIAYAEVVLQKSSSQRPPGATCATCLEDRDGPHWQSPAFSEAYICLRCIKQSSTQFEKDPESGWKRPGAAGGPGAAPGDEDADDE